MNKLKLRAAVALAGIALFGLNGIAQADSTDDLLKKLRDKGILNEQEYDDFNTTRDSEKAKKLNEIKASFHDGIVFESGDKSFQMQINGRVQLDGRYYGKSDSQNLDQMDLRRAYLGVKGKIYNDYDFNVTADYAQGQTKDTNSTSQLDVAYFGINWWDQAKFRFGQFDMPFGMEHLTSDLFIDFQERSLTDALVPGKERGAMVHGAPIKGVYYALAASTGRGKNVSNQDKQVEGVDVIGRLTANIAEIMGVNDAVYHVGGDFSHGYISQNQTTGSGSTTFGFFSASSATTEGKGIKFFSPAAFSSVATTNEVERTRYGLEGAVAYGPFKFQSEWMKHNYDGKNNANTSFDKDVKAWYAAVNWMVTGESFASTYKDGVWGRMKPKNDFIPGAGIGAVELSLRYSDFDGSDFDVGTGPGALSTFAFSGKTYQPATGAHAWTAGVQWILNPNTRLMANYVDTKFEDGFVKVTNDAGTTVGATNKERALTVRAQFDF